MAELEISIPYKGRLAQTGLVLTILSFPVWGVFPFMALCGIGTGAFARLIFASHFGALQIGQLFLCLASISLGLLALLFFADNRITISKEGLCFPRIFLPLLNFKRQRSWREMRSVTLDGENDDKALAKRSIRISFASGAALTLYARGMSIDNLNRLVLAMDVWASPYLIEPAQLDSIKRIARNNATPEAMSYTTIWEEELGRRFHSTSYVPLEPGHLLKRGRLKVIRQLSFGGLSAIYLAQQDDKELLVIKEAVIPSYADEKSQLKAMELFEREAILLTKLEHPSVSKVYDHFVEDSRHYLLLQYIQGQDLRLFVKHNGPQPESAVLNWCSQIASILDYLHSRQPPIIHRDLTPDNLVLRGSGEVCLIDFGAANEFMSTATGTLVGKQAYIAPEQFRGKTVVASDIYSLGCTMFFLLTGKDPEPLTVSHPRSITVEVSEETDRIVAACTQLDLVDRSKTASEIGDLIDQIRTKSKAGLEASRVQE